MDGFHLNFINTLNVNSASPIYCIYIYNMQISPKNPTMQHLLLKCLPQSFSGIALRQNVIKVCNVTKCLGVEWEKGGKK